MSSSPSLAGRAALAVALMVGFYVLALAMAAFLLWLPYAEWTYAHRIHPKLALACVVGAGAILFSIVPRIDRFEAPGPRLEPAEQPRLFRQVKEIARAAGQAVPAEVYLVNDVNAWVAQRGGWMGFGSRPVMGLGLPLMTRLSVSEFRGVLAHEFGHYCGGDTRLGPWVYKTRAAIGRTLQNLADTSSVLQKPFVWYGNMFLRVTHAISRAQELAADALAARIVGAPAMARGLTAVHGAGQTFGHYWSGEAVPVLSAGFLPSLTDGFRRFLDEKPVAEAVARGVAQELAEGKADPYDTHPPLRERIAALGNLRAGDAPGEDPPALGLLDDVPALERRLLATMAGDEAVAKLQPVGWEEAGERVFLPQWRTAVQKHAGGLGGLTPAALPQRAKPPRELARTILGLNARAPVPDEAIQEAAGVVGCALAVALHAGGHSLRCVPGAPITFHCGGRQVEPFGVLAALADSRLSAAEWQATCEAFHIAEVDLGQPSGDAA
jgi:Zn-dependent protease with chaperone function